MKLKTILYIICLFIIIAAVSGCLGGTTKIRNVFDYQGSCSVRIEGVVTGVVDSGEKFLGEYTGYYTVRDDTGEIDIFTKGSLPESGQKVTVFGTCKGTYNTGVLGLKEKLRW